jgi:hypothetical protein
MKNASILIKLATNVDCIKAFVTACLIFLVTMVCKKFQNSFYIEFEFERPTPVKPKAHKRKGHIPF